ncbi:hypothetical protein ACFLS8_04700, partial [Chloroflexota bacterium]
MPERDPGLYDLTTGGPVTDLTPFPSPADEYRAAFADRAQPFLNYYSFPDGKIVKQTLTRGEFWNLAGTAAAYLGDRGLVKGDRVVHCLSANSPYDLVFRLAAILTGCVPVTINWQADSNETAVYKAKVTGARLAIYDSGFAPRIEEIKPHLPPID